MLGSMDGDIECAFMFACILRHNITVFIIINIIIATGHGVVFVFLTAPEHVE